METPAGLRYTADHEWVLVEADIATVGITDYAQDALGDVVFVQLPAIGTTVVAASSISEVESTKSVSDIYAPLSGVIVEINSELDTQPSLVNTEPYGAGWMFKIRLSDQGEVDSLLSPDAYTALVSG